LQTKIGEVDNSRYLVQIGGGGHPTAKVPDAGIPDAETPDAEVPEAEVPYAMWVLGMLAKRAIKDLRYSRCRHSILR
jgi:hypothetical protein